MTEWVKDADGSSIWHLDGITWWDAPVPWFFHHCRPQTKAIIDETTVLRCACGALYMPQVGDRREYWIGKNVRRKE